MKRNRVLLARGASATALTLLAVLGSAYGCSGADEAPPSQVGSGGSGGSTSSSGGSSGTNDSGLLEVGVPPDPSCTDKTDSDGDSIADQLEGDGDTDGDGKLDKDDLDSDDDGISDEDEAGPNRSDPCSPVANTDQNDDGPDFQDFDADSDGVIDSDEKTGCDNDCRVTADCDEDGVVDIVEQAAGSDDCDVDSLPADASLYFIVPFNGGPQTQRFKFSTGIKEADIYFMIDTTNSMQPAIDNVKASLNSKIIPSILNGDASATPPIPAIPGAYIGVGDFKDVPWPPYGNSTDDVYRTSFCVGGTGPGCSGGSVVKGDLAAPKDVGGSFEAPDSVREIINSFTQSGGGDAPESLTQALYLASTSNQYAVTGGGIWPAPDAACDAGLIGRACFRPGKLPLFVIITDAALHNGPQTSYDYGSDAVGSIQSYTGVVDALNGIGAKIVGIPVDTGVGAAAKSDLEDLAEKTNSTYSTPAAPGVELPLVTKKTKNGDVATEVVRLIGLLAGQGLKNVTTATTNYDCPGGTDCTGDGLPDNEYHNFEDPQTKSPFDASTLIVSVSPVPVDQPPRPYNSINDTTFFGVRGDQIVEFEVTANNTSVQRQALTVVQAQLRVRTPTGTALGGPDGIKTIYLVIPRYRDPLK